jgi:outer membrane receptor protein involved in Fe transport
VDLTADLGLAELTSATGYGKYEEHGQRDQTDLLITLEYSYEAFPEFAAYTRKDAEDEFVNQEVRLVSQTPGPLIWIVGGFYNHRYTYGVSQEFTPGYSAFLVGGHGPGFRPDALEYYSVDNTHLIEKALFGEVSYDITDTWDVTLGARRFEYTFRTASDQDFPLFETLLGRTPNDAIVLDIVDASQEDAGWLYKFDTSWKPSSDLLLYMTVSQGYRIGNSNGLAQCDPDHDQRVRRRVEGLRARSRLVRNGEPSPARRLQLQPGGTDQGRTRPDHHDRAAGLWRHARGRFGWRSPAGFTRKPAELLCRL